MLLRLSLFLCQFETLKLFRNSLIFFTSIGLPQELKCSLLRLRCLHGFIFEWLIIGLFFLSNFSISIFVRVLPYSFRSSPRATMFEIATSLCSFSRLSAVAIIRLDIASGVSSSEKSLVPTYRYGSTTRFIGLI